MRQYNKLRISYLKFPFRVDVASIFHIMLSTLPKSQPPLSEND